MKRLAAVLVIATAAAAAAQPRHPHDAELEALKAQAEAQERAGDYQGALATFKKLKDVSDRIFEEDKAARLEELRVSVSDRQRLQLELVVGGAAIAALVGFGLFRRRVESGRVAEQLSITDTLTGLKNRRFVLQTMQTDIAASDRRRAAAAGQTPTDSDIVFMIIDIDRFKAVNDQYGHRAGDAMLTQVAHLLHDICRMADTIARWGGEEFLVISRFTDRKTASILAERIRTEFADNTFELGEGRTLKRTCSIGFASYPFSSRFPAALSWEQIVAIADEALYMAKRSGRNAWIGADAGPSVSEEDLLRLQHRTGDTLGQFITEGIVTKESSSR